jgi:hypothetical protein
VDFKTTITETKTEKGPVSLRWVSQLMLPGRREWDVQTIQACLYPRDVEEVIKIRLSDRISEDYIAWNYERSGFFFTVKSAYKLALSLDREEQVQEGSV